MNNFVFALAKAAPFSKRASEAGIVTLQGMLTIFGVLAILWAAVEIMHAVLHAGDKKKKTAESAPAPVAVVEETPAVEETDDGATVAAIIAAITAMRAEEGNTTGFRVVSFKRNGQK